MGDTENNKQNLKVYSQSHTEMQNKCPTPMHALHEHDPQHPNQGGDGDGRLKKVEFSVDGRFDPAPTHNKCFIVERGMPEGHPESTCVDTRDLLSSNHLKLQNKFGAVGSTEETKDCCAPPSGQYQKEMEFPRHVPAYDPQFAPQTDREERLTDKVPCFCPGKSPRDAPHETEPPPLPDTQSVGVKAALHSTPEPGQHAGKMLSRDLAMEEKVSKEAAPCYLSQLRAAFAPPLGEEPRMDVIGPWATGVVEWGPTSGITGVRPVADHYSVSRYSEAEWKQRSVDALKAFHGEVQHACNVDFGARECAKLTGVDNDRNQHDTTKKLSVRAKEVHHWKTELEHSINKMADELNLMEIMRQKLKNAMGVCQMPESISGECLSLRATRLEPDLIKDQVEIELIKERALVNEVHDLMERMLKELEEQQKRDKTIKAKLEMDWSDKKESYDIETMAISLRISSPNIMWKPGSVQFSEGQPSLKSWEHETKQNLNLLEMERARSVELRNFLESFTNDISRDLLRQAERVDSALARRVAETEAMKQSLEDELQRTLKRIVDTERLVDDLKLALRNQDKCIKKAQTRLASRELRPRTENCRDDPQFALIAEVKSIEENIAAVKAQLRHAEESLAGLLTSRGDLERDIMVKRKSLMIDRDRLQKIRAHYPASVSLSGY